MWLIKSKKASEAVIIAAGKGSRIVAEAGVSHKCLLRVSGIEILSHIVFSLWEAGTEWVHVVLGFEGDLLERQLSNLSLPVPLNFVHNPHWELGNGTSALIGASAVTSSSFILSMADHWMTYRIPSSIIEESRSRPNVLAVDRDLHRINDIEDATKVLLAGNNRIERIDKKLTSYDAIDCGVFRFQTDSIRQSLLTALSANDHSLSGGVRELIKQQTMYYTDVSGAPWQDIDTMSDLEAAVRKLTGLKRLAYAS